MDSIDHLKSTPSSEDQINTMIMMMMQLPEFSSSNGRNDAVKSFSPPTEFYGGAANPSPIPIPIHFSSSFTHLPSTTISFSNNTIPNNLQQQEQSANTNPYEKKNMTAMREMMFRIAAMQPINIDPESVKPPKRRNVKISKDPQSVAARHRRERISERIRILQRLVPGGTKMDTASMLDEAIHYVKFLKKQVQSFQRAAANSNNNNRTGSASEIGFSVPMSSASVTTHTPYFSLSKPYQARNVDHYGDV